MSIRFIVLTFYYYFTYCNFSKFYFIIAVVITENENVEVGLKSLHGTSNKGSRSNTASPSRLGPHRRIAAWARELVDDFHAIEEAHKGKGLTESGDDPGETLAIKRFFIFTIIKIN